MNLKAIFLSAAFAVGHVLGSASWTQTYKKFFTHQDKAKPFVFFSSIDDNVPVMSFNQLIFSWNAMRPKKGTFVFYGRVRDKKTGIWLSWHRMATWGKGAQKSHYDRKSGSIGLCKPHTIFEHVRLEVEKNYMADGFEIKVTAHNGADLTDVKMIAVCVSDTYNFKSELKRKQKLRSVQIKGVPLVSQMCVNHPNGPDICSPISLNMVVSSIVGHAIDPVEFANNCFDQGLQAFGSWALNCAHAYEWCHPKGFFYSTRLNSFKSLHRLLKKGIPVVLSVRGTLKTAYKPFPNGHLLVVVGYDDKCKEVICHDPRRDTHQEVVHRYELQDFLTAWEKSQRLAYVFQPRK